MGESSSALYPDGQTLGVWSHTPAFMSLDHHHFPSPSAFIFSSPMVCTLTPLLLLNTHLCWAYMSRLPTTATLFLLCAHTLFVEASISGMCCDCTGLGTTDVPVVVWPIVRWYFGCGWEMIHGLCIYVVSIDCNLYLKTVQ